MLKIKKSKIIWMIISASFLCGLLVVTSKNCSAQSNIDEMTAQITSSFRLADKIEFTEGDKRQDPREDSGIRRYRLAQEEITELKKYMTAPTYLGMESKSTPIYYVTTIEKSGREYTFRIGDRDRIFLDHTGLAQPAFLSNRSGLQSFFANIVKNRPVFVPKPNVSVTDDEYVTAGTADSEYRTEVILNTDVEKITVTGAANKKDILKTTSAYKGQATYCYERFLIQNKSITLKGGIVVEFVIGISGTVTDVSIGKNTMNNLTVEDCIKNVFKRMPFPANSAQSTVAYPIEIKKIKRGKLLPNSDKPKFLQKGPKIPNASVPQHFSTDESKSLNLPEFSNVKAIVSKTLTERKQDLSKNDMTLATVKKLESKKWWVVIPRRNPVRPLQDLAGPIPVGGQIFVTVDEENAIGTISFGE